MLTDPYAAHVDVSGGAPTTENYTLTKMGQTDTERYRMNPLSLGQPRKLKISHTTVGKGTALRDRHLCRLEAAVVENNLENWDKVISVYVVADIPRIGVTSTQKSEFFTRLIGLLRGASGDAANAGDATVFWNRWLQGEG